MTIAKALLTSQFQNWKTPRVFKEMLDREFHFDFDPCPENHQFDGLNISWGKSNFVNPPYNQIDAWMRKALTEALSGKIIVFLCPARTDTRWFHEICLVYANEIRFINGRIGFERTDGQRSRAPFPSMLVIFNGENKANVEQGVPSRSVR